MIVVLLFVQIPEQFGEELVGVFYKHTNQVCREHIPSPHKGLKDFGGRN